MKKRIIALLLALVMVVGMLPTVALAADAPIQDEDGYYQLTNEADLKWFRDKVNAGEGTINARLMADIALTESWTPIGVAADYVTSYDNEPFSGIFDGNEKTISGLNVTETAGNPAALFGMAKNATIKKLVVKGTVSSTAPSGGYMPVYAGGVVGQSDGGVTLEEVASYVDVTMTNSTSNTGAIGGLAGNGYGITIKNCANYGKLTAEGSAEAHIGGLSAISPWGGKAAIENSVNVGEIVGGSTVGGLITKANDGTTVKNSATVGEPAGTLGGTFENCLATANTVGADGVEIVADMKDAKVLTTLGSAFKKGEKSGFPILTWMTDTEVEEPECKHEHTEPKYESKNDGTHTVTTICKDCGQTIGEAKTEDCTDKGDGTCVCGYKRSYYGIRNMSDKLCRENGLSVVVPGKGSKGKSYAEYQAEKVGTSWKGKLKIAVDTLIPQVASFEELLQRLQAAGYEIKPGKYISCRAPGQERFTRLKTLGTDYTEEAIRERIEGKRTKAAKAPKEQRGVSLLIDIENSIKAQESRGYEQWAKIHNLKLAAKTMNFLTEHKIEQYADLVSRIEEVNAENEKTADALKSVEKRLADMAVLMKHVTTYQKTKPVYEAYRRAKDKDAYRAKQESSLILHEAAVKTLKAAGVTKLPNLAAMQEEYGKLQAQKEALYADYGKLKKQVKEYDVIKQNIDNILRQGKEPERKKGKERE